MATIIRQEGVNPAAQLPRSPGVYLMKDARGAVLYIGKANVLADRVHSYFLTGADHSPKTARMVEQVASIDYLITRSELEALILESNLVKKHKPRFNVILRDDKNYPFLRLSMEDAYPRLEIVRRVKPDGARYYGPYVPTHALRDTLRLLRRIFPLPNCNIAIDGTADRHCIEYEIKRCLAPCTGRQSQPDYHAMIEQVRLFLEGRDTELLSALRKNMEEAAVRLDFETAAQLRDQIANIERVLEKQRITSTKLEDQDVWAVARGVDGNGDASTAPAVLQLLFIRGGMVVGRKEFFVAAHEANDAELLASAIEQYYAKETVIPPEIVVPAALHDAPLLARWLGERKGGKVTFRVPRRGHDADLLKLAQENARAALSARLRAEEGGLAAAERLQ
ncbi:MAG: excinuclease ABC subunit UvrC, partial [Nitrospirota bacterium]